MTRTGRTGGPNALRGVSAAGGGRMTTQVIEGLGAQDRPDAAARRPSGSGMKRLDPEALVAHLTHLLRAARESAEDLVQETVATVLSRPRLLRNEDERA
jgi:hypothetical protein